MNDKRSSNMQAPSSSEAPSFRLQLASVRDLELVDWNFSGAWSLVLGV
jgi:hypothetical protein